MNIRQAQLPKGWEIKKLGEVCELINRGVSPKYIDDNGMIVLNQKCVREHEINFEPSRFHDATLKKVSEDKIIRKGDVLVNSTGTGTLGRVAQVREELDNVTVDSHITIVRPIKEIFYPDFFGWALILIEDEIASRGEGCGGQTELSRSTLKNDFIISYPKSLAEQQRIVAILDEAFAAIAKAKANAQQNLQNAKELFESYLQGVFENKGDGWEEKTLEQISKTFGRGKSKYRPRNFAGLYGGDYPFIQTGDIRNCDHFVTDYTQTYNEVGLAQSRPWPTGTICITIAANIAETGILTFDACFPDSVIGIVVNEKFADRDFVEYLLQSFKVRIQALGKGSAQANINMGTFENEHFPFPPLKTQQTIVQKLDALNAETKKLESIYKQKINDLEELKKSVLQKAFSGELSSPERVLSANDGCSPSGKNKNKKSPERA